MTRQRVAQVFYASLIALGMMVSIGGSALAQPAPRNVPGDLPEPVLYGTVFHHVIALQKQAAILEKKGEDGSKYRLLYRRRAKLDEQQARALDKIAADCQLEVTQQDQKAWQLIAAARAQVAGGRLAKGQTPKAPPKELAALQQERNDIVLKARDRLREALGDQEFERFDAFVRETIGPRITVHSPAIPRTAGPRQPALTPRPEAQ